ncbi:unnamed protein product [Rhodiola kirilowii]
MDVGEKRAKSQSGDELDRISALPIHIRESILECLPIKTAMRTSVLAQKWRYCWTGMRYLEFDDTERENAKMLHRVVERVLLIHSGPITQLLQATFTHTWEFDISVNSTCTEYSEQPLVINALNLRELYYVDDLWGAIIFNNVPRLVFAELTTFDKDGMDFERPCSAWGLICSLSLIKELVFDISLLGPVITNVPRCLPTMFQNLKTLTLRSVDACVEDHMRFVLCLIRSSPGLQDLTIYLEWERIKTRFWPESEKSREAAQKLLETEAKEHCKLCNLKTVVLYWFGGSSHEIMLVKILLSRCPNLVSFKVTPDYKRTADDNLMAREIRDIIESVGLTDRITQLPDEVREYILGYLTISDAVRSSVLSQKWRYTWTKAVQLNFHFKENMKQKMSVHRYFRLVGRVLLSHVGPIHKCVFKWDGHEKNSNLKGDINACLQTLSRKGIKDLTIFGREYVHSFELPPSIFDCLGLSSLTLGNCTLQNYISFKGFPNLVRLNLSHVDIIGDILEKVISKCPLEMLYISFCTFCSSEIDSRPRKNAISAPNLRVLDIVCYYNGLDYSYLKNTPNLKAASFWMAGEGRVPYDMMSNCYYILKSMPKVEVLTFDCRLHKNSASDIIPNTVPQLLENLKTLDLHCMDALSLSDRHGGRFVYDKDTWEAVIAYLDVVDKEEIKTSITTVCVTFGRDTAERVGADIAFIDIIISCCPALGNLVVNTSSSLKGSAKLQLSGALRRKAGHQGILSSVKRLMQNCSHQGLSGGLYKYTCRKIVDKDSLRAVITYLEVEAKEEIRTSITTLTVSFESSDKWEHIGAEIALMESIVSCCPALGKLVVKRFSYVKGHAKLQLSRALRQFGRSSSKPKNVYANAD